MLSQQSELLKLVLCENENVEASISTPRNRNRLARFNVKTPIDELSTTKISILNTSNRGAGEDIVSAYIHAGRWKYIICESYDEAHDFQWYVIDQLKPLLNKNVKPWNKQKTITYQSLLQQLLASKPMSCAEFSKEYTGPGVYVFLHEQIPKVFLEKYIHK